MRRSLWVVLLLVLGLSGSLHAGRIFQTISHDGSSNMIVEVKVEDYFDCTAPDFLDSFLNYRHAAASRASRVW
jgi:hypothetical protein